MGYGVADGNGGSSVLVGVGVLVAGGTTVGVSVAGGTTVGVSVAGGITVGVSVGGCTVGVSGGLWKFPLTDLLDSQECYGCTVSVSGGLWKTAADGRRPAETGNTKMAASTNTTATNMKRVVCFIDERPPEQR
jgi:hypothetical protein